MTTDPSERFRGVFPAIATPFAPDGSIDHDQLRADARRLERAGVDGVVPAGSTGESATMTHDEHVEVIETVVDAVDLPVVAGTGSNNTDEALSLSRRAADAGADGLLLISPYYNRPEPAGMEAHYRAVADAVDLPQIVYNVPGRTGRSIDVETTVSLASHPNVAGYKAASGDLGLISEVVERTRDEAFAVLSGDDALTLPVLSVGGVGTISVVANVEPERTSHLVWSALENDVATAREHHHALGPLVRQLFVETNPVPVKEALAERGHHDEPVFRSPLSRLSERHRPALRRTLEALDENRPEPVPAERRR
ncbi:MAG: 4-hydroxy-tetrahydrodipicolinate synthase [Halobacteriaceae archaeon]